MMRLVLFKERTPENFLSQWYEDTMIRQLSVSQKESSHNAENYRADSLMLDLASRTVRE